MLHGFRRCGENTSLTNGDGGMTQRLICRDSFRCTERTPHVTNWGNNNLVPTKCLLSLNNSRINTRSCVKRARIGCSVMDIPSIRKHIEHILTWWFEQKRVKFTLEQALNVQTGCRYSSTLSLTSVLDGGEGRGTNYTLGLFVFIKLRNALNV
jgi:hypothetical protein